MTKFLLVTEKNEDQSSKSSNIETNSLSNYYQQVDREDSHFQIYSMKFSSKERWFSASSAKKEKETFSTRRKFRSKSRRISSAREKSQI